MKEGLLFTELAFVQVEEKNMTNFYSLAANLWKSETKIAGGGAWRGATRGDGICCQSDYFQSWII